MQPLKHIAISFLISFIGALPPGYLNIEAYQIYSSAGIAHLMLFLLGVIVIEAIVVNYTLVFAQQLSNNKKLTKYINLFSICFLLVIAFGLLLQPEIDTTTKDHLLTVPFKYPLLTGLFFSAINLVQLPFWSGWNLYLINKGYIFSAKKYRYWYVVGALGGSVIGITTIAIGIDLFSGNSGVISKKIITSLIPYIFIALALFQANAYFKRYNKGLS